MELTDKDIEFLKFKGFKRNEKSGYFSIEDGNKECFLIPHEEYYKLEFYEYGLDDGDGNSYDDYSKEESKENESLESFISYWFN